MEKRISYHTNFIVQIIGFFEQEYAKPFEELVNTLSMKYTLVNVKENTDFFHLAVLFICNEQSYMSVRKKLSYFNKGKNCEINATIIIPTSDEVEWGFKLRKGQKKDNYSGLKSTKTVYVENNIDYTQFTSMNDYFTYCCDKILNILIDNEVVHLQIK
ncbi:Imm9 family immunity protein [Pasteurella atlantica]|uniref:Imm9 family immunity protein n=1 Tax=Pasteurellaceae TaxID=712 RepID=UPI0027505CDE|nr:Imm9 family immunity protein [Pasteurella atlantica]MDP8033669.1 Imm9 family immunity protein [Pasteurella atlantica]MDP8035551.1 Imm9 family immunity protein [Pasteurella atlantica]MDP8037502.1 Imm9 family immunity protein [Pasteurella atlantica]MDP8047851.1 Imm9 family immunity protein [Pasteurella atlantica]MDP8049806.1 Imm9 family immunity protein [Pasteurella atlantica]